MSARLLLSFVVATFIAGLATVWVLADVRRRLDAVDGRLQAQEARTADPLVAPRAGAPAAGVGAAGVGAAGVGAAAPAAPFPAPHDVPPSGAEPDPLASRDPLVKLDALLRKLDEQGNTLYDTYNDVASDLMALKREVRQLKSQLRSVAQALAQGGARPQGISLGWGLAPKGAPIGDDVLKSYLADAEGHGIKVEEGRVTARAMLNLSPNRQMPIEYFITRYPESGHETLVHLVGDRSLDDLAKDPVGGLKGLGNALYKGLVAAGFKEGEGSRPDPEAADKQRPRWLLPTGDVVYLYVRYQRGGATHLARATDWVLDPSTGTVLPEDAFRFTGSVRGEDPDTGDDVLAAEMGGLLVSVWQNPRALLEVALDSAEHNDYQYNSARIPRPEGEGPLMLDLVFSRTRLEPEGEGAAPLPPPAALEPLPPQPEKPPEPR